ncbi:hypothetical protein PPYR_15457 [Photinus pyralis]|uniref:Uncharacterized protein n=2 Tax=Photinus pyralis TaxID=7054 RepID=A0A5N3ZYS6_PHOPY|nr:trafficking protein particle complex subunit 10 [Photinus pyralis]KAB0790211.1 hypothetical protein PPYR_15457 [Photinus pyralis]
MNGVDCLEPDTVDRRPIITCAGELEVFSALEDSLTQALPQDSCELRRSLGRPVRLVHIGAHFIPFSPDALPKENQWDLIRQPLFHVYWTECTDVDAYKTSVKDDIESWMKEITGKEISDWLIVVVESYDGKRTNKLLPRTTVLDRIRADFATKQGDRCISVINPGRLETRSADSWRGLVGRVRHLVLVAYARAVVKLEDHVRHQREKRNEPGWDFMNYFSLQEELAQVLEMLGLYDEALVQYDELDVLFSQFIVNGHIGELANWLHKFQKPLERWHGLKLGPSKLKKNPSFLELRAYLFAKQAHMLLLTNKVWEMAARCLPFLHGCIKEFTLLDVSAPPGAVSCWLFLASMEVLQTCDHFNQADQVDAYSANTAALWAYASQKLRDLGELCGLLPGESPTSAQLHMVVGLSAGMGDCPGRSGELSPTDKLKKALSSQDAFNKNYLELAELAMGTYKHIGHLRSARLIGLEVASFYMLLSETLKAGAFLGDALRTFELDGWHELAAQTQVKLAECYRKADDVRKFIASCAAVSAAPEIDNLIRLSYFDEMRKCLDNLDKSLVVPFEDIIKIMNITIKNNNGLVMHDGIMEVQLVVDCNFPREVLCTNIVMTLDPENKEHKKAKDKSANDRTFTLKNVKNDSDSIFQVLHMQRHLDYKQDKQLSSANVVCKNVPFKRKNSSISPRPCNFDSCLEVTKLPIVLTPGINVIRLTKKGTDIGKFYLAHVAINIGKLSLISNPLNQKLLIEVIKEEPSLRLDKEERALLYGLEQTMQLHMKVGSYAIARDSFIKITASRGVTIQYIPNEQLTSSLEVPILNIEPFTTSMTPLRVFAEHSSKDHQITLVCPWSNKPIPVTLSFSPLLAISWRLHTVQNRKFIHITLTGQSDIRLQLSTTQLDFRDGIKTLRFDVSDPTDEILENGLSISYVWEILITPSIESPPLKAQFSTYYTALISEHVSSTLDTTTRKFTYNLDIANYQTLYVVEIDVQPTKGNEFCRVGALCNLNLCIKPASHTLDAVEIETSLMYEVLAEPTVWAVCGRTAGVVSFETDMEPQIIVLEVMPLNNGFLPLPLVRLSKYIPADASTPDKSRKGGESHPRLEPFSPGQVYNASKGHQVHVIAGTVAETTAT